MFATFIYFQFRPGNFFLSRSNVYLLLCMMRNVIFSFILKTFLWTDPYPMDPITQVYIFEPGISTFVLLWNLGSMFCNDVHVFFRVYPLYFWLLVAVVVWIMIVSLTQRQATNPSKTNWIVGTVGHSPHSNINMGPYPVHYT